MDSNHIVEMDHILLTDEDIDPREVIEHIPIIPSAGPKNQVQIVSIRRMIDDNTSTGHNMNQRFYAGVGERFWKMAMFQKQGIFVGNVQVLHPFAVGNNTDVPIPVRIQNVESFPRKELERAFADPSVGTNWSPYAITLDQDGNIPRTMRVLIIEWRPTKKKTKKFLKSTTAWLVKIGIAVAIGETHDEITGDGLFGGHDAQGAQPDA